MKGMLKAEQFKFRNSFALWIIIGVISATCFVSIILGIYSSAEQPLLNITKDCMVPILACAVYGAVILTDDFSNGILRHYIASGYNKDCILFAKLLHYILGCSILLLVYPCLCVSFSAMLHGAETAFLLVFRETVFIFFKTLPLYLGIFGLFFFFSVLTKNGAAAVGISIAVSIILVAFTNRLYGNAISLLKYSPIIQISKAATEKATGIYFVSVFLSLVLLAICAFGSILKFRKDELS